MKAPLVLLISCFISCGVAKEYLQNDTLCLYDTPIFKITEEDFFFNFKKYDTIKGRFHKILVDNEKEYYSEARLNSGRYSINKQTNKQTNIGKWIDYYPDGKIYSSTFMYEGGFSKIGKETYYDPQGNITKIIDHDKGYTICWAEAIELVKKRLRKKLSKYESVRFVVERTSLSEYPGEKPMWRIGVSPVPDDKPGETTYYRIDGVTGKYRGKYKLKLVEY